ncbi:MAG: beta-lactamase family protein [Hyphomonadaceae bacterium]|nr:beta-lactamase family protein [Hyphomonadaceae bacterium]
MSKLPFPIDGFCARGFEPVRAAFEANFAEGLEVGAGFAAVQDGEVVVELWGGHRDRESAHPWNRETLVPVFSTTKPISALVIGLLVGGGSLDYEALVSDYWPEWGEDKKAVTVAGLLSHQAGIPGFADPIDANLWLAPSAMAAALADLAPMWEPMTAHGYHPMTWGYLVGEIVLRTAGRSLGGMLREEVCVPLGIDFWIGLPASEDHRLARLIRPTELPELGTISPVKRAAFLTRWAAPDRGGEAWRRVEIPSANGHGGALAVARLYQAYACQGRIGGVALIEPDAMRAALRTRAKGQDLVLPFDLTWAAGIMRNSGGVYGPNLNALGHSGWGGSMGLADPDRRLSAAYVMNRQSNKLQGDRRAARLVEALYACF